MPVVIDGNNLLYAARAADASSLLIGRSMLCDALGAWGLRRKESIHVVFDGPAPAPALAEQIGHPDIQVTYSGAVSADAIVTDIVNGHSAARRVVVVSSDREVARAAKRRGARPVRSEDFWALLQRDLARPQPRRLEPEEKRQGLRSGATEEWIELFGLGESVKPGDSEGVNGQGCPCGDQGDAHDDVE